jgi:hypothetical protein
LPRIVEAHKVEDAANGIEVALNGGCNAFVDFWREEVFDCPVENPIEFIVNFIFLN